MLEISRKTSAQNLPNYVDSARNLCRRSAEAVGSIRPLLRSPWLVLIAEVQETGLRVSELLALRWRDVDFENLELRVTRSIWHQVVGDCKTEASAKPVPMDEYMAEDLKRWHRQSPYPNAR